MTRVKGFDPDVEIKEGEKSRFLSNTPEGEAKLIVKVFKDLCTGEPMPCHGATKEELLKSGIVGVYEVS